MEALFPSPSLFSTLPRCRLLIGRPGGGWSGKRGSPSFLGRYSFWVVSLLFWNYLLIGWSSSPWKEGRQ